MPDGTAATGHEAALPRLRKVEKKRRRSTEGSKGVYHSLRFSPRNAQTRGTQAFPAHG